MSNPDLPQGPGHVCFDASPLIQFADANALATLATWFHPRAFTASVITKVELVKNLPAYPQNAEILKLPWLHAIDVDEEDDLRLISELRRLWGSKQGRDHGEAEVVALARRYGWVAILDDGAGRDAAKRNRVPHVSTAGLIAASVAGVYESHDAAWALYQRVARTQLRPIIPPDDPYEPAFRAAADATRRIAQGMEDNGDSVWPQLLADPRIDQLVRRASAKRRSELGS